MVKCNRWIDMKHMEETNNFQWLLTPRLKDNFKLALNVSQSELVAHKVLSCLSENKVTIEKLRFSFERKGFPFRLPRSDQIESDLRNIVIALKPLDIISLKFTNNMNKMSIYQVYDLDILTETTAEQYEVDSLSIQAPNISNFLLFIHPRKVLQLQTVSVGDLPKVFKLIQDNQQKLAHLESIIILVHSQSGQIENREIQCQFNSIPLEIKKILTLKLRNIFPGQLEQKQLSDARQVIITSYKLVQNHIYNIQKNLQAFNGIKKLTLDLANVIHVEMAANNLEQSLTSDLLNSLTSLTLMNVSQDSFLLIRVLLHYATNLAFLKLDQNLNDFQKVKPISFKTIEKAMLKRIVFNQISTKVFEQYLILLLEASPLLEYLEFNSSQVRYGCSFFKFIPSIKTLRSIKLSDIISLSDSCSYFLSNWTGAKSLTLLNSSQFLNAFIQNDNTLEEITVSYDISSQSALKHIFFSEYSSFINLKRITFVQSDAANLPSVSELLTFFKCTSRVVVFTITGGGSNNVFHNPRDKMKWYTKEEHQEIVRGIRGIGKEGKIVLNVPIQ
ncbi:hypothetical protein FGO68_gene16461 [Halteria grandinella]|uniref:Uncharacterized protein n=1 Tax=Halteria grandinella TaxID=5974 RepID=A0A8J8SWL0_HALGN|nr:hypothetical protein FGO68_gene16461 [Halteria grandinella]